MADDKTFEEQVGEATSAMVQDDDGKWGFPADAELDDSVKYAANLERRRRDTQTALAKEKDNAARLQSENELLGRNWEKEATKTLTDTQRSELEELKHTDPEAWRTKIGEYEAANKTAFKEKKKKIADDVKKETELQKRNRLIKEHNEANPKHQLTDDVIDNDIPPRITKKLADGKITFEEFIDECNKYLGKGKVVKDKEEVNEEPDLSKANGGQRPTDVAVDKDIKESYKKTVF